MTATTKPAKKIAAKNAFSADEKAAMKERAAEMKAAKKGADGEAEALAAIAKMDASDRKLGERVHALVKAAAPQLSAKTWYGMPAYANADGKIVVFFQNAGKFKYRYATLGFNEAANLDDGNMWPTSYALTKLSAADEARITALVKQAAG
jgi:uncharacterized protein YdhG (YjbR/CyaY superfamily)